MSGALVFSVASSWSSSFPVRSVSLRPRAVTESTTVAAKRSRTPPASLYQVLRVEETATAREIKAAYRSMAKRFHPDAAPAAGGPDFLEIRRAYETLSDPAERARYDRSIARRFTEAEWVGSDRLRYSRWETDQCW